MSHFPLTAPAWQLLALQLGVPLALSFLAPYFLPLVMFGVSTLIFATIFMWWLWTVAETTNSQIPVLQQRPTRLMASGFIYVLIYIASIFGFLVTHSMGRGPGAVILIPHLLAMVAMFYGLWFTAKQLATLKQNGPPPFLGTLGAFFMLWYFPIGVWFVQPVVRKRLGRIGA